MIKGQKINDRYEIIRNIGEGGMANVYLAYDLILNRNVALKVLRGDLADDEKFVRRFQREANSASSLHHPNIVEMYDVGEDDGKYYIVMEYLDGRTLKSLVKRRGALTILEVVDIMTQLTSAIACAHDKYIIHRDIKPQNVMILEDGKVKITDFGIAMALNSQDLTQTNSVMGSVHYLAPEQASGGASTIKCDIYSLGILMYELLTGKVPFKGENAVEIAIKQMKDPIPSVRSFNEEIPQSIENIVLKACAKNPKNRYDSVNEMYDDIIHALDDEHRSDQRLIYKYPEQDTEETKEIVKITNDVKNTLVGDTMEQEIVKGSNKKLNLAIIISSIILFILLAILCFIIILYPKLNKVKEAVIPDVKGMTILEAEQALKKAGFETKDEYHYESSDEIEEGKVKSTSPVIGASKKVGTKVTLNVSSGKRTVTVDDYTGKLYYEVKGALEAKKIKVTIDKKSVENKSEYEENTIISQSVEPGIELKEGEQIILFIPDIVSNYPNFKEGAWTVERVKEFCKQYKLRLTIKEEERTDVPAGTVVDSNRTPEDRIVEDATITITIAKQPGENVEE